MSKLTFKDFLIEYQTDTGNIALAKQAASEKALRREQTRNTDDYRADAKTRNPETGNLIRGKHGYYVVIGKSVKGTHIRPLGKNDENSVRILSADQYRFQQTNDEKFPNKIVYQGKKVA